MGNSWTKLQALRARAFGFLGNIRACQTEARDYLPNSDDKEIIDYLANLVREDCIRARQQENNK